MVKNRTVKLMFQTAFCVLAIVGSVASLGIFDDIKNIRWDFYIHFTNLGNFFCIVIMFCELIQTIKNKEDGFTTFSPVTKFIGINASLLTFLMFNLVLAGAEGRNPQFNWRIGSILFHIILPIMYIVDWLLFYEKGKSKWYYPFATILFPLGYAIFIYVHAAILKFDRSILIPFSETPLIYPYFFLDIDKQGVDGVAICFLIFFVGLVALGYIFFGVDKLISKLLNKQTKQND